MGKVRDLFGHKVSLQSGAHVLQYYYNTSTVYRNGIAFIIVSSLSTKSKRHHPHIVNLMLSNPTGAARVGASLLFSIRVQEGYTNFTINNTDF